MIRRKNYPLILAPRGYVEIDGTWRHVYVRETYSQTDIFGSSVNMLRVQLSKGSKVLYAIEEDRLQKERPRKVKERID